MTRGRGLAARLAVPALALVLLAGCAGGPLGDARAGGAQRREYAAALRLLAEDPPAGEAALESFLEAHPRSSLADEARLRLARQALAAGRNAEAVERLRDLVREHPTADESDEARLLLAKLLRTREEPDAAYRVATTIRLSLLDGPQRREAHRLLADLAAERGDAPAQLRWLARVRADAHDDAHEAAVDAEIESALSALSTAQLEAVAEQLGRRVPAARVRLRLAERALAEGRRDAALASLERARKLALAPADAERLAALEAVLEGSGDPLRGLPGWDELAPAPAPDPALARGTVGAILPLSGPYAAFGEESLQGILLAAGRFDDTGPSSGGVRVVVRDSAGQPERAARAVRELAADPQLVAVVGPLLADGAEAAGRVAEEVGLPLLTLTRREEVAALGRHVLRLGAAPRLEARLLAEVATDELGAHRFAILYPDDAYGRALRAAFWDAVEARGGEVVGVASYDVDATDFAEPIRRLIGYDMLTSGEKGALAQRERVLDRAKRLPPVEAVALRQQARAITGPGGRPLPPIVDFDALFIPDTHEKVGLIAPHLAFHEVTGVRLLGPSGWNHPDLVAIGGSHVEGAVFTAAFHAESRIPFVEEFTRRFRATFAAEPSFVAAQAFDAANLVLAQLVAGRRDREALLAGLLATHAWPGVSGVTSVDGDGGAEKRPFLLGVEDGRIVSVDERGRAPEVPGAPPAASSGPSS